MGRRVVAARAVARGRVGGAGAGGAATPLHRCTGRGACLTWQAQGGVLAQQAAALTPGVCASVDAAGGAVARQGGWLHHHRLGLQRPALCRAPELRTACLGSTQTLSSAPHAHRLRAAACVLHSPVKHDVPARAHEHGGREVFVPVLGHVGQHLRRGGRDGRWASRSVLSVLNSVFSVLSPVLCVPCPVGPGAPPHASIHTPLQGARAAAQCLGRRL